MHARLARAAWPLSLLLLGACASGQGGAGSAGAGRLPTSTPYDGLASGFTNRPSAVRDSVVYGSRDRIWAVLPSVFAALDIEAPSRDPRAFQMGNPGFRASSIGGARLSQFLECGAGIAGPNADNYDVTLQLWVQLEDAGPDRTRVRTVVDATARSRYGMGDRLQCASPGTLEARVTSLIMARVPAPPPPQGEAFPRASQPVATAAPAPVVMATSAQGRPLAIGDVVRVACTAGPTGEPRNGEGAFLGTRGTDLLVDAGTGVGSLAIPAGSVVRLELRERRSHGRTAAVVGGGVGALVGGFVGRGMYDPASKTHYRPGVYTGVGAVLGAAGGAILGRIVGSFFGQDAWVGATLELVPAPATGLPRPTCEGLPAGSAGGGA